MKRSNDASSPPGPGLTKSGNKKRVRRVQAELGFFREQVRALELQLARLELQQTTPVNSHSPNCNFPSENKGISLWNEIAGRQFQERLRAQEHNNILQTTRAEMLQLSAEMQTVLQRSQEKSSWLQASETAVSQLQRRFWDFSTDADDEVFSEQLTAVVRLYLELKRQSPSTISKTVHYYGDLAMGQEIVKLDPKLDVGIMFEVHCGTTLPFTLDVVTAAYWRFLGCRTGFESQQYVIDAQDSQSDVIARSFDVRVDFDGFVSQSSGKYTCRKYVDEDEITLVLADNVNVSVFGIRFQGLQYHKRGYIKLRRVSRQGPGQQSTATVVETHFETIPVFHDSVADKRQKAQSLVDLIRQSYSRVNQVFCQTVGSLLLEEDWKATFGSEASKQSTIAA